ncbi:spinocerebellar ataxia type 10 protein domain-containing protein [Paraphysoderma sedebokerense]|nr:spinocerebellar ataxia type 10 protein domain-containing protein [Paraphysoderma sedebokerense]
MFRLIRNGSAGVVDNQQRFCDIGAHEWIIESLIALGPDYDNVSLIRIGIQALCNCVTSNVDTQKIVLRRLLSTDNNSLALKCLLNVSDTTAVSYVLLLLYNCVHSSVENSKILVGSSDSILCFVHMLEIAVKYMDDEDIEIFDWVEKIIFKLIDQDMFASLWQGIKLYHRNGDRQCTPAELTLLRFLDRRVFSLLNSSEFFIPSETLQVLLSEMFSELSSNISSMIRYDKCDTISSVDTDGLILLLEILGMITVDSYSRESINKGYIQNGVLENCIGLLATLQQSQPSLSKLSPLPSTPPSITASSVTSPQFLLKRDLIKLIAHLSYNNPLVQNKTRELHGLELILNNCKIDDLYPYIKEYSTLALRNLLEKNAENQMIIEKLQPQSIDATSGQILRDHGLTAEVKENGKVEFSKDQSNQT